MLAFLTRPPLAAILAEELYDVERQLLRAEANLTHWRANVTGLQAYKTLLQHQIASTPTNPT